jgi:hypothetical protein
MNYTAYHARPPTTVQWIWPPNPIPGLGMEGDDGYSTPLYSNSTIPTKAAGWEDVSTFDVRLRRRFKLKRPVTP